MSLINPLAREVSAKVVYYGPGLSGKTTSLKYIYEAVRPERRGQLLSLATEGDRTIFFDFLPVQVKEVRGMGVRFQLYTVPGQVFYEATRRLVLNGADGVVFVADSQRAARDSNLQSFDALRQNLIDMGIDIERFPIVVQYNKRDLPDLLPVEVLANDVNPMGAPAYETNAVTGAGILEALKDISGQVVRSLYRELPKTAPQRATPVEGLTPTREAEAIGSRSLGMIAGGSIASLSAANIETELQRLAESAEIPLTDPGTPTQPPSPPSRSLRPTPIAAIDVGLSFTPLWEGVDAQVVAEIEEAIRQGAHKRALERSAAALASLLESIAGTLATESPMAKASLLGLDGREYLRFVRLVTLPDSAVTERDALFGLYMLIAAKLKAQSI